MNAITRTSKSLTREADAIHAMHYGPQQHLALATLIAVQMGLSRPADRQQRL